MANGVITNSSGTTYASPYPIRKNEQLLSQGQVDMVKFITNEQLNGVVTQLNSIITSLETAKSNCGTEYLSFVEISSGNEGNHFPEMIDSLIATAKALAQRCSSLKTTIDNTAASFKTSDETSIKKWWDSDEYKNSQNQNNN